jgi:hypothetical protein
MNNNISENELALCRQMGVAPEDYLQTRENDLACALCQENSLTLEEAMKKVMKVMGIPLSERSAREEQGVKLADAVVLSDIEKEACQRLGVVPEEYLAHKRISAGMVYGAKLTNGGKVSWE